MLTTPAVSDRPLTHIDWNWKGQQILQDVHAPVESPSNLGPEDFRTPSGFNEIGGSASVHENIEQSYDLDGRQLEYKSPELLPPRIGVISPPTPKSINEDDRLAVRVPRVLSGNFTYTDHGWDRVKQV